MKYRQQYALEHPAFWFDNVGNWQLRKDEPQRGCDLTLSTIVCMDAYKPGVIEWHVVAALQRSPQDFIAFTEFSMDMQRELVKICLQLLEGVGVQDATRLEFYPYSMHAKRPATNIEAFGVENHRALTMRLVNPVGAMHGITREQSIDEFNFDPLKDKVALIG